MNTTDLYFSVETNGTQEVKQRVFSPEPGLVLLEADTAAMPGEKHPEFTVLWEKPDKDIAYMWNPTDFRSRRKRPHWSNPLQSDATHGAPILVCLSGDDRNRMTIACSDAKSNVAVVKCGTREDDGVMACGLRIRFSDTTKPYHAVIRIDLRDIPFYRAVQETAAWWETFDGYTPAPVPDGARLPMLSTWYSFHHDLQADRLLKECAAYKDLGCEAIIVDGGWYHESLSRGGGYCGDWEPAKNKFSDMKAFADGVHALGMKFLLWYSVSFIGIESRLYQQWKDKTVGEPGFGSAYALDPRYPEVRAYLIGTYENAVKNWGVDGFKFDFLDFFKESDDVKDGMDHVSVNDAVDTLMKDVLSSLRAINPHILIEFRQPYAGPLMRSFGNMIRAHDCPGDSYTNRQNILSLRMISGHTAVHSDMVAWNTADSAENAAFQLTSVLFAVPQISMLYDKLPERHREMIRTYLSFWREHRETLLDGELYMRDYGANYAFVSAKKDGEQVGAVYTGRIATVAWQTDTVILINASHDDCVFVEGIDGGWTFGVTDCAGIPCGNGAFRSADRRALNRIDAPVNGYIVLKKQK